MKRLKLTCFTISLILLTLVSQAQKTLHREPDVNKPKLFTNLPERIAIQVSELEKLITNNTATGKDVAVDMKGKGSATFAGKVVATASKYGDTIRSIVIRSTSFQGATFSLSAITQPDGKVTYTGRIMSFKHGDVYELEQSGEEYFLVRKNFYDLINE